MSDVSLSKRAVGAIKNAIVWGVAWGALGSVVAAMVRLSDGIALPMAILDGIGMGARIGFAGGIVGFAFAAFIALVYRNRRVSQIDPLRFGIAGALLAGIFLPFFMQGMNVLSGDGAVPWRLIASDIVIAVVFGGLTAWSTMKLAQSGAAHDELPEADDRESLASGTPDFMADRHAAARRTPEPR